MRKILLFLIAGAIFLPSAGWSREGDCDDAKIVYLSAFEVDPNLLLILDNSESMNIIAQPTEENGYTYTTGAKEEYLYDSNITYSTPFKKDLQVIEDGWRVIGERSGKWVCAYFVKNDYSGGFGGIYEANYLNWLLNKAHLEDNPFADYGTDKFYRIELKRINTGYIKGIPRFVRDLTDEEGIAFLDTTHPKWFDFYISNDTIQGEPWYDYWYDKPASRINVARYAICELLRTDLKKINSNWEFKFCYGLMTFRNYWDPAMKIYNNGVWQDAENITNQWIPRGGELLVENGTITKEHLDNIQSHIATIEARWLTQLAEAVYEAGAYYAGTDTYFCVARGNPPIIPTIIKGPVSYAGKSPIQYWCQDNNILLITDGYPTRDTEVPPLKKLGTLQVGQTFDGAGNYQWFDYDGDGKEPPPYQELNPIASLIKWNTGASAVGCNALMKGSDDLWCSHYLDDVVEYYYKTDILKGDTYNKLQNINTYIVGFGYDSPFLKEAAEDTNPDGSYNPNNYFKPKLTKNQHRYFTATSKKKLIEGLMNIIEDIIERMSSSVAVSVSLSTSESQGEDRLVRAKFDPRGWKGYLEAYTIPYCDEHNKDFWNGPICIQKPEWEAGERLGTETKDEKDDDTWRNLGGGSNEKRMMYTRIDGSNRTEFIKGNFNYLKPLLQGTGSSLSDEEINALICWTRGEYWVNGTDTNEFNPGDKVFLPDAYDWLWSRDEGWRLFEIVYSGPRVVGAPNAWYGTESYTKFAKYCADRERVAYVGDGGGSLHCFKLMDDTSGNKNWNKGGWEKWAYIPSNLLGQIRYKAEKNHCRFSMVDLGAVKYDVYFPGYPNDGMYQDTYWRTVLIGGERSGGSQWFCLNITSPDCMTNPGSKTVLWEYEDRERLGDSYSYPEGGRIEDDDGKEKWLAFLTTGPQATGTYPYVIALDIATTTIKNTAYKSIVVYDDKDLDGSRDPGEEYAVPPLTSCSALDLKGSERFDNVIDVIYFGDTAGNLWKMKVGSGTDSWKPRILFKTKGISQPIAVSISIAFNRGYKPCLFFGSGRYLTKQDAVSTETQSFYCVIDKDPWNLSFLVPLNRSTNLNERGWNITLSPSCSGTGKEQTFSPYGTRTTNDNPVDNISKSGWFLDFGWKGCDLQTERVTEPALIYGGIVFFNSIIPDTAPCEAGGFGYFNAMDYLTAKITKEVIEGAGKITTCFLGKGAPSRPIIDVQNSVVLTQMSTGEIIKTRIKMDIKSVRIVNWGEEGIITCNVCKKNIVHSNFRQLKY
ncbi:MAG: PilC/PilY family type IV pilus protein [bacterium]|nr:PilC/PilY family type IV pilus protein [bacterium]